MTNSAARKFAIAIVALTALLVAGLGVARMLRGATAHVDLDTARYPVRGLDLSAHNGVPDFDSIAAAGYSFVYLKASEGTGYRDPAFMRNYLAARRAGLAVGAYHFFRFECDGPRQAENFLGAIGACDLQLPAAIDVEEWGNPIDKGTEIICERLDGMLAMLDAFYGPAIIYTNKNGDARFVRSRFDDRDLWICSFTDPPLRRRPWAIWQHSHVGDVPGVDGHADLDVFNGDTGQWLSWLGSLENTIKKAPRR